MSGTESSSSESVQEADNLKDSDLNGVALHEDARRFKALSEPQFISCLSDASSASPIITKSKLLPIVSSKAPEELQFIGCLSEGGSVSPDVPKGKIPTSGSSLTSKCNGYSNKLVVELKAINGRDKNQFEESALADDDDDVQFVKQQSSASSENNEATSKPTETSRSRQSSVELIGETRSRPSSSQMHNQRTKPLPSALPRAKARKAFESPDIRRGPKYDGIDRSAERAIS